MGRECEVSGKEREGSREREVKRERERVRNKVERPIKYQGNIPE
jgi:hypothetical protein